MPKSQLLVYIPREVLPERLLERLGRIAKKKDRSVNYVAVRALLEFLEREEPLEEA